MTQVRAERRRMRRGAMAGLALALVVGGAACGGDDDDAAKADGAGFDNATIARRLALSPKTVRNHLSNVPTKLQVADRAQAIVRAREAGFGGESPR